MSFDRVLPSPGGAMRVHTADPVIAKRIDERLGSQFRDDAVPMWDLELAPGRFDGAKWDEELRGRREGARVHVEQSGGRGTFDFAAGRGRIEIDTRIEWFDQYFENALRILLVEAAITTGHRIFHSAAVAVPDLSKAWLFFGPSGAGKTTTTETCHAAGYHAITDDLVVLGIEDERVIAKGCVFHGTTKIRNFAHGAFPVQAFFRLEKAPHDRVTRLPLASATRELLRSLVMYRPFTRAEQEALLDFALALAKRAPVYRLELRKSPDFIAEVLRELR